MNILTTFPGRTGDLLWALPTVRAISETYGEKVALLLSAQYYAGLAPLLEDQAYLDGVMCAADWQVQETAPISPRIPPTIPAPGEWDRIFHLGYEGWPHPSLPHDIYGRVQADVYGAEGRELTPLMLDRPWITPPSYAPHLPTQDLAVGFTDEHFELKYGLYMLLWRKFAGDHAVINVSGGTPSPRWVQEAESYGPDLRSAAAWISRSRCFVGCCSALHVLAVAMGIPAVVMEPNPHRWNPIFWPLGTEGPQVRQVLGGDGQPTFDARHVAETIEAQWARQRVQEAVQG